MTVFTIRECQARDAEVMASVHAMVMPAGWSAQEFHDLMVSAGVQGTIASVPHNAACGILLTRTVLDECEILTLGVLVEMQRHGVATALLEHAFARERQRGVRMLHLEVREDNAEALGLYAKLGFLPTGRRTGYYETREGRKDAIVMSRTII